MSLEVELHRKAGQVCLQAQSGQLRCPCIIRKTSEDVVTGTVFGCLRHIRPHLWLQPLLNIAFETNLFRQVFHRQFSMRFWERQTRIPPELLTFAEGRSEIDLILEWENEPTTVWIEAKLFSGLATGTSNCAENDQVLRGVRTLLHATGHAHANTLFNVPKRRPLWLALLSEKPHRLVEHYRQPGVLNKAVGPPQYFGAEGQDIIGTITWGEINNIVADSKRRMNPSERSVSERLTEYLDLKLAEMSQVKLPPPGEDKAQLIFAK